MKKTIIDLFEDSVVKYGAKTFLLEKKHRAFEPTTYAETKEQALEIGAGLAAASLLLGRELAVSLPFAAAAHPLFRWAQRRTLSE